ncbi:MAG TPA: hypothetical protein VF781_07270 [Solirubrobacteraceae bacterium]
MWLSFPTLILVVLMIIGGIIGGGVFTFVLVPVAVIAALVAIGLSAWSRSQAHRGTPSEAARTGDPLPHSRRRNAPAAPATPDDLVSARQHQQ